MPRRRRAFYIFGLCPWCGLRPDKSEGPSPDQGHSPGIIWLLAAGHSRRLTSGGKAEPNLENTIYFASVNYALRFQESATSLITPTGQCQAYLPYGQEGVLVQEIKVEQATGLLATRYAPERYQESGAE